MPTNKSKISKVKGILKSNDNIRDEMLKKNYWKNKEYTQYGDNIGKYSEITTKELDSILGEKSLYEYTHDKTTKYGHEIDKRYFQRDEEKERYEYRPYYKTEYILPREIEIDKTLNEFNFMAERNSALGDKKNTLEKVGDYWLLQLLSINNNANSLRRLENKYITPSLDGFYGSNPQVQSFKFHNNEGNVYNANFGRIADIPESEDVKIIHDVRYITDNDNNGLYYLKANKALSENKYGIKFTEDIIHEKKKNGKEKKGGKKVNITDAVSYVDFSDGGLKNENGGSNNIKIDTGDFSAIFNGIDVKENGRVINFNTDESSEAQWWDEKEAVGRTLPISESKSLLDKTYKLFTDHRINTMISRHCDYDNEISDYDTAVNKKYGHSHGRNLTKLNSDKDEAGYENPYCRSWTKNHQYSKVEDLIRPFSGKSIKEVQEMNSSFHTFDGDSYLNDNTVLNRNGFVNITPSNDIKNNVNIKNCMFSIENLAWKDVVKKEEYISKEQTGPNGGRIMWFPPYGLDFQENVNVDWDQNSFIGRGEKVYTYKNTDRAGTLSFTLLIDHPGIVNDLQGKQGMGDENDLEADVLRFFAGCQLLDLKKQKDEGAEKVQDKVEEIKNVVDDGKNEINFYTFFPNNYSGNNNITSRDLFNTNGCSDIDWYYYLLLGNGIDCNIRQKSKWRGYEIGDSTEGIGESENKIAAVEKNTEDTSCRQWKEPDERLCSKTYKYFYRTDFDLRSILVNPENYEDRDGISLNSNFEKNKESFGNANYSFAEVITALLLLNHNENETIDGVTEEVKSDLKIEENSELGKSMEEISMVYNVEGVERPVYMDANGISYYKKENYFYPIYEIEASVVIGDTTTYGDIKTYVCSKGARESSINELIEIFKNINISSIDISGCATEQDSGKGNCIESNSQLLAFRRKKALSNLLKKELSYDGEVNEDNNFTPKKLNEPLKVYTKEAKLDRYAYVSIKYNAAEVKKASEAENSQYASVTVGGQETITEIDDNSIKIVDDISMGEIEKLLNESDVSVDEFMEDYGDLLDKEFYNIDRYETEADYFSKLEESDPFIFNEITKKFRYFNPAFHSISPEGFNARLTFLQQCTRQGHTIESSTKNGYAQTAGNLSFGRMPVCVLRIGDFINTKIIITSLSINYSENGGMQWDLNPEGIGVQPMFAKVSMSIVILGGQSLSGPINRLQNAVSFDYYANAGVYDNRADRITIKPKESDLADLNNYYGKTDVYYDKLWTPYPNK